jgi:acyl carrier protein
MPQLPAKLRTRGGRQLTVLDRTQPDQAERVALIVRRIMEKRGIVRPVGPEDDLRDCGLASLDIVNLMLSVETELGVKIPEREMTPTNFRSIARIVELVGGLTD